MFSHRIGFYALGEELMGWHEAVADPPHRLDIARFIGVVVQLLPQPTDEDLDVVDVVDIFWSPDTLQQELVW